MGYEDIVVSVGDDFVAEIKLNRPTQLNTFTLGLAKELDRALWEVEADNKVRVVLIKGEGQGLLRRHRCQLYRGQIDSGSARLGRMHGGAAGFDQPHEQTGDCPGKRRGCRQRSRPGCGGRPGHSRGQGTHRSDRN